MHAPSSANKYSPRFLRCKLALRYEASVMGAPDDPLLLKGAVDGGGSRLFKLAANVHPRLIADLGLVHVGEKRAVPPELGGHAGGAARSGWIVR